ncbi:SAC3 domain-containing protein 1 [Zerene cesonia]|uniref:SAC3 domain-containing protein 1 n=1 Tax=Zerene cesonia TaxID=33412 RepID=UPI0018E5A0DC|nr:SAC3 domain-containing protein 1 [Zerene cesonia]
MSYLDYLQNKNTPSPGTNIAGKCNNFCPQEESALRKREKLIHILEVVGNEHKLIKAYSRSAADSNMAVPKLLRPFHVLRKVVHYLLHEVSKRSDVPLTVVYDFLNDRLRAVRQDMTIQRLPPEQCMDLLEPIIQFHVFFALRLRDKSLNEFDPVLNNKYLLECMKWFLSCCDETDRQNKSFNIDNTTLGLESLSLNGKHIRSNRELIESLYILCNLDDLQPMLRFLNLPQYLKRKPQLRLSYEIAAANLKNNFIRMCTLSQELCPLTQCAFYLYLPSLQRRSLQVLCSAYNSKTLTVPIKVIQQWLLFDNVDETMDCCKHYGLAVGDGVCFNKAAFKNDVKIFQPKCSSKIINMDLEDFLNAAT